MRRSAARQPANPAAGACVRTTGKVRRGASRSAGPLGVALALAACVPNATVPDPKLDVPSTYRYSDAAGGLRDHAVDWWTQFRSAELNRFMEETEVSNLSIAAAIGQLEQADAAARITGSALFPFITASDTVSRSGSGGTSTAGTLVSSGGVGSTSTGSGSGTIATGGTGAGSTTIPTTGSNGGIGSGTTTSPGTIGTGQSGGTTGVTGTTGGATTGGGTTGTTTTGTTSTGTTSTGTTGSTGSTTGTTGSSGTSSSSLLTSSNRSSLVSSFAASYQLDLWGKNRAAFKAAQDSATASRWNRQTVQLTELATVANTYFNILAARERVNYAKQDVVDSSRILTLIQDREKAGTATALDVAQQAALVANLKASIPPLEVIADQDVIALGILLGRTPQRVLVSGKSVLNGTVPRPAPGIPSEVLTQRPDIEFAEANLASAHANLVSARAAFFPQLNLTAQGGFSSTALSTLFTPSSSFYSVALGVTQPIFDAGLLRGQFDETKGQQDVLLANYRLAVITAFSDVDRALVGLRRYAEEEKLTRESLEASRLALKLSEDRLKGGVLDVVTLLQTEQTLFTTQDTLVQVRLLRLTQAIALYQALGGAYAGNGKTARKGKRAI